MTAIPHPTMPMTQYVAMGEKVIGGFEEGIQKPEGTPETKEQTNKGEAK